jgi:hypothetical protein
LAGKNQPSKKVFLLSKNHFLFPKYQKKIDGKKIYFADEGGPIKCYLKLEYPEQNLEIKMLIKPTNFCGHEYI